MVKYALSIDGIDNSGKSTLIKRTKQRLNERFETIDVPANELSSSFPSNPANVRGFFVQSPIDLVVSALLEAGKNKSELMRNSNLDYGLLDRGFIATVASCAARTKARNKGTMSDALSFVDKINRKIGYSPLEKDAVVLSLENGGSLNTFEDREESVVEPGYKEYMKLFGASFKNLSQSDMIIGEKIPKVHIIDATKPQCEVQDKFEDVLETVTDIRYHRLMNEFLDSEEVKHSGAVLVGGSYLREDLIPNWSDVDAVCVVNSSRRQNLQDLSGQLSEKYGIRFNPKFLTDEDLENPSSVDLKALLFFLPEYPSQALHGTKTDLGLKVSELKGANRNAFYDLLRFYEDLKTGNNANQIDDKEFIARGLRLCFNLTRVALFDQQHVVSSYEDTKKLAHIFGEDYENQLQDLMLVRKEWNYDALDSDKIKIQIEDYVSAIGGYFENE